MDPEQHKNYIARQQRSNLPYMQRYVQPNPLRALGAEEAVERAVRAMTFVTLADAAALRAWYER